MCVYVKVTYINIYMFIIYHIYTIQIYTKYIYTYLSIYHLSIYISIQIRNVGFSESQMEHIVDVESLSKSFFRV